MAEAFGLAASILGVAELGISVTQSLYRFTVSYRGADRQVEEIEGRVSVTATILQELHNTVKSNEQYFKRNPTGALEAPVSSCRRDYQRLKDAVDEVKSQPKDGAASTLDKKMAKMSAREKLKWALGGDESMDRLLNSLKSSKEDLGVLIDLLNYRLLIRAESRKGNALSPDMAADLAELKRQLPVLVQLLQIRGLVPINTASKSEQDDIREKEPSSDRRRGLDNLISPHEHGPEPEPECDAGGDLEDNRREEEKREEERRKDERREDERREEERREEKRREEERRKEEERRGGEEEEEEEEEEGRGEIVKNPPAAAPLHNQPSIATSLIYEAYMFKGEVEKSYPIERILISERELTELAAESQSPSALSALARLPAGHRTAVNKLLIGREDEKGSILGLMPIKGKKSWWTRLTRRHHKDRHPQVVILLQFEQDIGQVIVEEEIMHRRIRSRSRSRSRSRASRTKAAEVLNVAATGPRLRRMWDEESDLNNTVDQGARAYGGDIIIDGEREEQRPIHDSKSALQETLPSQEEAEKLMDTYLAGFTTFSDDGDEESEGA